MNANALEKVRPTPEQERVCQTERFGLSDHEYNQRRAKVEQSLAKAARNGTLRQELVARARDSELMHLPGASVDAIASRKPAGKVWGGWTPT